MFLLCFSVSQQHNRRVNKAMVARRKPEFHFAGGAPGGVQGGAFQPDRSV